MGRFMGGVNSGDKGGVMAELRVELRVKSGVEYEAEL